ncbi:single-stranded DNA-binding protein [Flexivirga caeni]|uniref:Single-stranded DNA-binding protein n=1 Tax=Flexivirga caeni TaxID=2294115 RepID=A0A3M9M8Y0_9MICO|nr:single-stranded DNA-binding protein [Flexivirga caeni]RNI21333.1 single-stranded DNA-binding protein [Flexivirga caeni]
MNETSLTIRGNLTADPERITGSKGDFTTFRVAVNEFYRDQSGNFVDGRSSFYSVVAYRQLGSNAQKSLSKGDAVVVHGVLRVNQWESNGQTRSAPEIEARSIGPDLRFGIATYQRLRTQRQSDQVPVAERRFAGQQGWPGSAGHPDGWAAGDGPAEPPFGDPGFAPEGDADELPASSSGPLVEQAG